MNVSFPAGPPFSLLRHSSVEIRNCLIISCLNGAGHLNCAKGREGRQAAPAKAIGIKRWFSPSNCPSLFIGLLG